MLESLTRRALTRRTGRPNGSSSACRNRHQFRSRAAQSNPGHQRLCRTTVARKHKQRWSCLSSRNIASNKEHMGYVRLDRDAENPTHVVEPGQPERRRAGWRCWVEEIESVVAESDPSPTCPHRLQDAPCSGEKIGAASATVLLGDHVERRLDAAVRPLEEKRGVARVVDLVVAYGDGGPHHPRNEPAGSSPVVIQVNLPLGGVDSPHQRIPHIGDRGLHHCLPRVVGVALRHERSRGSAPRWVHEVDRQPPLDAPPEGRVPRRVPQNLTGLDRNRQHRGHQRRRVRFVRLARVEFVWAGEADQSAPRVVLAGAVAAGREERFIGAVDPSRPEVSHSREDRIRPPQKGCVVGGSPLLPKRHCDISRHMRLGCLISPRARHVPSGGGFPGIHESLLVVVRRLGRSPHHAVVAEPEVRRGKIRVEEVESRVDPRVSIPKDVPIVAVGGQSTGGNRVIDVRSDATEHSIQRGVHQPCQRRVAPNLHPSIPEGAPGVHVRPPEHPAVSVRPGLGELQAGRRDHFRCCSAVSRGDVR
eukprot:m.329134 g.329134  ORF g.329134 m.329134 type:complete len:532 (+) comp16502_c1_seq68:73-1668(+)